jgi:hypothetical protein
MSSKVVAVPSPSLVIVGVEPKRPQFQAAFLRGMFYPVVAVAISDSDVHLLSINDEGQLDWIDAKYCKVRILQLVSAAPAGGPGGPMPNLSDLLKKGLA